jgi:hypothetical protein
MNRQEGLICDGLRTMDSATRDQSLRPILLCVYVLNTVLQKKTLWKFAFICVKFIARDAELYEEFVQR